MTSKPKKKIPLQNISQNITNSNPIISKNKTIIQEMYTKNTHSVNMPVEKQTRNLYVYEDNNRLINRKVTYVRELYKVFDEMLANAADVKLRDYDNNMDLIRVDIDVEEGFISVFSNGNGISVERWNGYGAKEYVVETADGKTGRKYKQVFSQNMSTKSNPTITKCSESENWTKITFKTDFSKFNMTHLESDLVSLMKKRVIDLAGTLNGVNVELNGENVKVKGFKEYMDLYLESAEKNRNEPLPKIIEKVNDKWEVGVSLSKGQFQQVSFVNGICTTKGGTHVECITNQISDHLITVVNKKIKNGNLKADNVRNHLWVFVNVFVDNPVFDSEMKETLMNCKRSFGSKCELSQDFLTKVAKSEIVQNLLSLKQNKEVKRTQRITGIPKLEDANEAGGKNSEKCTLILTEGDSAKSLAMAGISVIGRNYYGIFPLSGKFLNVKDANNKEIMDNAEIQNIKQILGLENGKYYDSVKELRYGRLMIMTDQDDDGSHIKGLLINFIHSLWPSLLKIPSFIVEFITPIVKATHNKNKNVLSFYSMPEYEAWKENLGGSSTGWSIKYYKGLGTSTSKEAKEYFQDIEKHKKKFIWADEKDGDFIDMAFSNKKIDARKSWLRQFEPGTYLDGREKCIKYRDFVNKELIQISLADLQRSIPSMVDGLKPDQRKILFCSFKRNFIKEAKVAQFCGYVSEHSAYKHGEQNLASTIIEMAQDFVGRNNINLLLPNGQFGTRYQGGKDHASAKYIYTSLSPLTRFLFPKDDDILLEYQNEDGQSIEPTWYMPIIPMVLINGSEGIGNGFSSYVPNYNPRDIIENVKRLLNDERMRPMEPWYKGFKGSIEKFGSTYKIRGKIEQIYETTLRVTELPIGNWTQDYKEFLQSLMSGNDKIKEPFIKDYREHNDDVTVHFDIFLTEENMKIAIQEGLEKKFKLTTTISTTNMHLFDSKGVIKKYDTPEQILEEFFEMRLNFYAKRKRALLDNLELDLLKLDEKVRFISGVINGEIKVNNRKRGDLLFELKQKGFTPFTKKTKAMVGVMNGEGEDNDEDNSPEAVHGGVIRAGDYEYLLSMAIGNLTMEKVKELCDERERLELKVDLLRKALPKSLWSTDLETLEKELDEQDKKEVEAEVVRKEVTSKAFANGLDDTGYVPASSKPRAKMSKTVESDDEHFDELTALKEPLDAHKLDIRPNKIEMEIEKSVAKTAAPSGKKAISASSSALSAFNKTDMEIDKESTAEKAPSSMSGFNFLDSEDKENEIPVELEISPAQQHEPKPKRGRKPAANPKPPAGGRRTRRNSSTDSEGKENEIMPAEETLPAQQPEEKTKRGRKAVTDPKPPAGSATSSEFNISGSERKENEIMSVEEALPAQQPEGKTKRGRKGATNPKAPAGGRKRVFNLSDSEGKENEISTEEIPIAPPQQPEEQSKKGRKTGANRKPPAGKKRGLSAASSSVSPQFNSSFSEGKENEMAVEETPILPAQQVEEKNKRGRKATANPKLPSGSGSISVSPKFNSNSEGKENEMAVEEIPPAQQVEEKNKRGRKAGASTKAPGGGRKRGPASEKLNASDEPKRKVRRKNSNSKSDDHVVERKGRPKRGAVKKAVYVESEEE